MRLSTGVVAALVLATGAARAAPVCQLQQLGDLPLSLRSGRLFVDARVNGRSARMIVATGAYLTQFSRPGATALGLNPRPISAVQTAQAFGIGGEADTAVARVAKFQLGALVARDLEMLVAGNRASGDAQGILGPELLEQATLDGIDLAAVDFFRAHRVYVAPGQRTVYVSYEGGPVFQTRAAAARSAPRPAP